MNTPNDQSDMAQYFDFGEASMPETTQAIGGTTVASPKRGYCPAHGNDSTDGCLCHGFQEDLDLPQEFGQQSRPNEQEWNPDFSNWIPRYHKPEHPCDYCRSRSLECFIYDSGTSKGCSPCNALFRECSFQKSSNDKLKSKTALDTLDVVTEDSAHLFGGLTGKKPMRSLGHVGPIETDEADTTPKKGAAAARFSRNAVKILKTWMIEHIDHPYPTDEEKEELKVQTGLTTSQVSNWMANTRRRQKSRPKRCASPSLRPSTEAINIPPGRTWDSLNPFERWKHSPPENEPAPFTAIARAVETFNPPETSSLSSSLNINSSSTSFHERMNNSNDSTGSYSILRAPSTTSLETGFTNMSSGSANSAWSYGSRNSFGSLNSFNSKHERRRRRRVPTRTAKPSLDSSPRIFQCTFCTDKFKSKYDWSRHEKSLHLSLEKWICAPIGEVVTCSASGQRRCVFCDEIDPTKEHLATHNRSACEEKGLEARTFYRKDHLRQHLRLMHGVKMIPSMDTWKSEAQYIKSRCGFCGMNFDKWQDRVDHLAKEFRNGATMQNWKGCRGLDAHVAALVTNAMPPYLIANESKSPFPFSATNTASMKQHNMYLGKDDLEFLLPGSELPKDRFAPDGSFIPFKMGDNSPGNPNPVPFNSPQNRNSDSSAPHDNPNATCWEILTLRLGRFARLQVEQHGIDSVTDEMLQAAARQILYDSDDPWNQTAADNPEWLALFKKAHGLPTTVKSRDVMHQHDFLEDLGLNVNAKLDPSFNLANFNSPDATTSAQLTECYLTGTTMLSQAGFATIPALSSTATTPGTSNLPLTSMGSPIPGMTDTQLRELCFYENGQIGLGSGNAGTNQFKSSNPFNTNTSIPEIPCSAVGEALQNNHFEFPTWDQLPEGFSIPGSTAELGSSLPAGTALPMSTGMNAPNLGNAWDDSELGFGLDMDMDLDMGMDLMLGTSANPQD